LDWRSLANALYSNYEWKGFAEACRKKLASQSVCVACSGGADSLLLLLLVFEWRRQCDGLSSLSAIHFNHCLRGEASDEDEAFVRRVCEALRVEVLFGRWDGAPSKDVTEDQARSARLAFFAKAVGDRAIIVTGHQRDDIAETMLMRLSRGAGTEGLAAPRRESTAVGGLRFVRPLLDSSKAEIVSALREVGATWREDASNRGDGFYRNRLRNSVIADWEAAADRLIGPGVALSRALLEEDARALRWYLEVEWENLRDKDGLSFEGLRRLPRAMQRRALAKLVGSEQLAATRPALETALRGIAENASFSVALSSERILGGDPDEGCVALRAVRDSGDCRAWLPVGATLYLPDGACVKARLQEVDEALRKRVGSGDVNHEFEVFLAWGKQRGNGLRARTRRPGDAYRPFGKSRPTKLKDLLSDRKIPQSERDLPEGGAFDLHHRSVIHVLARSSASSAAP